MKTFYSLLLAISVLLSSACFATSGISKRSLEEIKVCNEARSAVIDCVAKNYQLTGAHLKDICRQELISYVKAYYTVNCKEYVIDQTGLRVIGQVIGLEPILQDLVDTGREIGQTLSQKENERVIRKNRLENPDQFLNELNLK
jgi:hypothetical protein